MAIRKIEQNAGQAWELKSYVWRGKGEKSALTGRQVRPIVARDSAGLYHAGLRNWSYYGKGRAGDALYHPAASRKRSEAIGKAHGMCKEWVAAHRELAADVKRAGRFSRQKQSAAERYGSVSPVQPARSSSLHR